MRNLGISVAGALGALILASLPANALTHSWTFTDQNNNVIGSGTLTTPDNILITGMVGTINGARITFYGNRTKSWYSSVLNRTIQANNPVDGMSQIVNVPNTTGANYGYDDIYQFEAGVTYYGGIAISTGSHSSLRVYLFTRDSSVYDINTPTDLFSINPDGSYSQIEGTFTVTP